MPIRFSRRLFTGLVTLALARSDRSISVRSLDLSPR